MKTCGVNQLGQLGSSVCGWLDLRGQLVDCHRERSKAPRRAPGIQGPRQGRHGKAKMRVHNKRARVCVQVSLKQVAAAVTACIKMKDVFSQEAVTGVLSTLVHRQPLPPLIMRTLINTWEVYPDCRKCALCACLLYTSPSPRDRTRSRMPSSA